MSMAAMIARFSISLPVVLLNQALRAVGGGRIRQRARGDTERYVGCSARRRRPTHGSAGPGGNTQNNSARIGTRGAAAASPPPDTLAPTGRPGAQATRSCFLSFCYALGSGVRPPSQCPEHPLDIDTQVGKRAAEQRGATHEDHVIPCPLRRALLPIRLAQASPRPVALDRSAQPSANSEADLPLTRTRPPERDEAPIPPPPALPEDRLELTRPKACSAHLWRDTAGSPPHPARLSAAFALRQASLNTFGRQGLMRSGIRSILPADGHLAEMFSS